MKKAKISGFTLVELLIVISISALLMTVGVASYNDFTRTQILKNAASDLRNNLRYAQTRAAIGEKDNSACYKGPGDEFYDLEGWFLEFNSTSQYSVYGKCNAVNFKTRIYSLPSNVTVSSPAIPPSLIIKFKVLAQGVDTVSDITINLALSGTTKTQTVKVTPGGEIY